MSEIELYDFTRGQWKVNVEKANNAKFAFAIYEGIIQEVYSVLFWLKAGKTLNTRNEKEALKDRFEFIQNQKIAFQY